MRLEEYPRCQGITTPEVVTSGHLGRLGWTRTTQGRQGNQPRRLNTPSTLGEWKDNLQLKGFCIKLILRKTIFHF